MRATLGKIAFSITVILSLLALLSPLVPNTLVWWTAPFALFLPAFVALWLLGVFRALLKKKYLRSGIFVLFILASYPYWERQFQRNPKVENQSPGVKVLVANVAMFSHEEYKDEQQNFKKLQAFLDDIRQYEADFLLLQEFYAMKTKGKLEAIPVFKEAGYPHLAYSMYRMTGYADSEYAGGNLIASKYPLKTLLKKRFNAYSNNNMVMAEAEVQGKKLSLLNVHLESFKMKRMTKDSTEKAVFYLAESYRKRTEQAQWLCDSILPTVSTGLVGGDFNEPAGGYCYTAMKRVWKNAFEEAGDGFGLTWPSFAPLIKIDHLFASHDIGVLSHQVVPIVGSDHKGLLVELDIQQGTTWEEKN